MEKTSHHGNEVWFDEPHTESQTTQTQKQTMMHLACIHRPHAQQAQTPAPPPIASTAPPSRSVAARVAVKAKSRKRAQVGGSDERAIEGDGVSRSNARNTRDNTSKAQTA